MLHRSFKPVKCKTSLKLATSRLKLMKNKKGVQLNHMKRDLAQLLQSGQDQTARIRVEHVIREEKMITAFDLIEIYCELIAARLPIIESQKNCPIDLKEAITSVIFASPRCAEIPELLDIRKHFTAKYGKEFISRAIELRPDCGVSRMLIDKLSAVAPDGQTKMKVLGAIAEEHNIKWELKSFGEKDTKPPDDLLGWNTSEKTTKMLAESPKFQTPNVQALPIRDQNHDVPLKFSEQNIRSSPGSQNSASTAACGINTEVSSTSHLDVRPSGMASEVMEMRQSFPGEGNSALSGRQNWNMGFKDALSAAQAAAESAEQASMAARAAAELSNIHALRDERPGKYAASNLRGERPANDSVGNSFYDRNPGLKKEQIDWNEHDDLVGAAERFHWDGHGHGHSEESSRSPSSRFSETSIEDDTLMHSIQKVNGCSKKSSFEEEVIKPENPFSYGVSMKRPSRESGVGCVSGQNDGFKSENSDYFGEESSFSGDYSASNSNHWKFGSDAAEDPFGDIDQESIHRETIKMNSYDDDSSSDSDGGRFDMGPKYDEEEFPSYFSSSGRKSPTHFPPLSTSSGDNRVSREKSSSQPHFSAEWHSPLEFSESLVQSMDHSQSDNFVPVTFDYSDGPKFDSEEDMEKSWTSGTKDSDTLPHEHDVFSLNLEPTDCHCSHGLTGSSFLEKANSGSDRGPWLHTSSDDSDAMEVGQMKNQGTELSIDYPKESKEEPHTQMASKEVKYFDSDTGDSEEDLPKQTSTNTGLSGCGRRTKASPSSSETASYSRIEMGSSKASAAEQQNTVASSSNENSKTSSLRGQTSSGENNRKNASHVHPKLPDYDVVAAHLQSLMRNRE